MHPLEHPLGFVMDRLKTWPFNNLRICVKLHLILQSTRPYIPPWIIDPFGLQPGFYYWLIGGINFSAPWGQKDINFLEQKF